MHEARQLLVVFLKYPEAGKVKTRLAASLGPAAAVAAYRSLVALTLKAVDQWARGPGREVWLYFDPPDREAQIRQWLAEVPRPQTVSRVLRPQGAGDLGARLTTVFSDGFASGYQYVMAIGTDCPELTRGSLEAAANALARTEVSLGPASDGGYYLIGLSRPAPALFHGIPWSTAETLRATLTAAKSAGLTVEMLSPLPDIDTEADWRAWLKRSNSNPKEKTL